MSVFAGEEVQALARRVKVLEKAETVLDADRVRLADLLRDEKAAHQQTSRRLQETAEQLRVTRLELDRFKAIAQTVDQANDARGLADRERNTAVAAHERLDLKHAKLVAQADKVTLERDEFRQRCVDLEAEIGPFRGLLAAWQAQKTAAETISAELEKLNQ